MKYLCLGYLDKKKMDALPKEEIDAILLECQPHLEELSNSGHMMIDAGLAQEVKSLQRVGGKIKVNEGNLTQQDKIMGSAFILEARNMEEAIRVASLHPTVQVSLGELLGWEIEIRAIDSFATKD